MLQVLQVVCVVLVSAVTISEAQYGQQPGYNFFPGVYQGWPGYVPQAYAPRSPQPSAGAGGWDQRRMPPRVPQYPGSMTPQQPRHMPRRPPVDLTPVEGPERDHPNPGPSGPEHESEADIIPAKPDDGSGGGPTSATPYRPLIAAPRNGRFVRSALAQDQPAIAVAVATSAGGSVVREVAFSNGGSAVAAGGSGILSTAPLVPAGHDVVYYSDVVHAAPAANPQPQPQQPRPTGRRGQGQEPDQQPDESQQQDMIVAPPADFQQQQQAEQAPIVPVIPAVQAPAQAAEQDEQDGNPTANDQAPIGVVPAVSVDEGEPDFDEDEETKAAVPKRRVQPAAGPRPPVSKAADIPAMQVPQSQDPDQSVDDEPQQQEAKAPRRPEIKRRTQVPAVIPAAPIAPVMPAIPAAPKVGSKGGRRQVQIPQSPQQESDEDLLPAAVPQQAVKGGVKGAAARGGVKGHRGGAVKGKHQHQHPAVQVPEQAVKGQAPEPAIRVQAPEQAVKGQAPVQQEEQPVVVRLAPRPSSKGARRRVQVPEVDVEVEPEQSPLRGGGAVKGGIKGQLARLQAVKGQAPVVPQQEVDLREEQGPQAPEQEVKGPAGPRAPQSKRRPAPEPAVQPQQEQQQEQLPQVPEQAVKG